ncbi:PRC-barrel domain-containing protein [Clostridium sp. DJ247]|uniref:PRC-barrel domain-containing protein n=1 Tax=Clostridium sp. DJ247 TaxID=2726188 RepID=UPI001625C033|nr:PRC-barrel domain-containing protein [Clostridium sp. DJ247]MBC2579016.1 photosystem reaction center subunit H [Clostridium sp. DJ247]
MYRTKDFSLMDVVNVNGKRLGFINDLLIDFNRKQVLGFNVTPLSLFRKTLNIMLEDVISFNSVMVIIKAAKGSFLKFKDIKAMDVRDKEGNVLGMVEDILFDEHKFTLNAVIISTGFITNFISGKKIILVKDLMLGEKNLLYNGKNENINFSSLPHKLFLEDGLDEKI